MSGRFRGCVLILLLVQGCFLDRSVVGADPDAAVGCGTCPEGQACVDGACRADADDDGVPAAQDCDDTDAAVGAVAERPCSSDCASGVERCESGEWEDCDAPVACDCRSGDMRTTSCVMCGSQMQRCEAGTWVDGACTGQGACAAGEQGRETRPCGLCGEGTETRTRACSTECAWSEWSEWGECMGATGECPAGLSETETQACGACGVQTRTRTCSATCGWDDWSDWGTCDESGAVCTPGETGMDMQPCPCGSGMRRRTRMCTEMCTWGAWSDWSGCDGEECAPGATETIVRGCGGCGAQTVTRTCDSDCTWEESAGACEETRCALTCACDSVLFWTCCPTGDWSGRGDCGGC